MYDNIFDDFNTIQEHCKRNGNISFEESAVFELLENLWPQNGSAKAIQIILDMLDVQRIRDSKNDDSRTNVPIVELLNSDKSNDGDSVVEVEVLKKVHTVIDLTENSIESDEAIFIEKPNVNIAENDKDSYIEDNDSVVTDDGNNGLSDYDLLRHSDEDSNLTNFNALNSNNEPSLLEYLTLLEQPNNSNSNQYDGNQFINETAEISEILEENNNDPNNNLGDGTLDNDANVNKGVDDEDYTSSRIPDSNSYNSNDITWDNILNPMPGCSKDIGVGLNSKEDENKLLKITTEKPQSPIPGCSKDFDNSNELKPMNVVDESIQNDALCIQEIMSWAEFETIYSILKKYKNFSNRKQLTLDDLITHQDQRENATVKRKLEKDTCILPKKCYKLFTNDYIDESLLDITPNSNFENNISNESSNDSRSLKFSDCDESSSEHKDKIQIKSSNETELPEAPMSKEKKVLDNHLFEISNDPIHTNDLKTNEEKSLSSSAIGEIPEYQSTKSFQMNSITECASNMKENFLKIENRATITANSLNEIAAVNGEKNNLMHVPNMLNKNSKDADFICIMKAFQHDILQNEQKQNDQKFTIKSEKPEVVKPAKLIFHRTGPHEYVIKPNAPVVKPATFHYKSENATPSFRMDNKSKNSDLLNFKKNDNFLKVKQQKIPNLALSRYITSPEIENVTQKVLPSQPPVYALSSKVFENETIHINNGVNRILVNKIPTVKPIIKPTVLFHDFKQEPGIRSEVVSNTTRTINDSIKHADDQIEQRLNQLRQQLIFPKAKPTATITSSSKLVSVHNVDVQPSTSRTHSITTISKEIPDRAIYNKLRSIFPEVKKSYVKQICINPPIIDNVNNREQVLNILIDHLLSEGSKHLRPYQEVFEQQRITSLTVDEKYENLLGIFPDADPTYLREFVEKNPSEQDFEQFVQQKLESRDYPTKEQYMARIKVTEQIKQYTTDFNVERFLQLFPDPFKHFENTTRQCIYQPIAMEFLKSMFNKNKVNTITKTYSSNGYNLSLTAKTLSTMGPDMKSKRSNFEMPTENIPLLQEMTFVKNKRNIENHLNMLKVREEQLFNQLKGQNLLLTCQCCFNDECMPTKSSECNKGHGFCYECIIRGTESTLADGEAQVRCFTECDGEFPLATLQKVLPPTKFSALLKKRQAAEVIAAGVDGLVSCPYCHFASIPPPEDKVFKCLNPECMKETCRYCKELNHVPLKCDEVIKADKARRIIEEKMTQALIRTCYQCKKQFYKEDGCNKMKCSCGALMCYLCDKPVKGYNHFNAQGGANTNLCPLWSDDRFLNAKAVIKVAEDVKNALLKDNPNLKIDTEGLLPKLPPKSRGPHDDIPNANQLPEHVRRVAGAAP